MVKPKKPNPRIRSSASAPKGFKRVVPKVTKKDLKRAEKATEQQRFSLNGVADGLSTDGKVTTAVSVHMNKDATVDGELRVFNIHRGYRINDLLTDISSLMHGGPREPSPFRLPPDHWVSTGALVDWGGTKADWDAEYKRHRRRGLTGDEARYLANAATSPLPRYKGHGRFALFPQRADRLPENIFRAQQSYLGERFRDRRGKLGGRGKRSKPDAILIRVHWNPQNRRPGRK